MGKKVLMFAAAWLILVSAAIWMTAPDRGGDVSQEAASGDAGGPRGEAVEKAGPSREVLPAEDDPPAALFGYQPNPEGTKKFLGELPNPEIRQAGPGLFQIRGPPKDTFLYRALYKAHEAKLGRPFRVGNQGIGDCVGWGWAHGCDVHLATMWAQGDSADWWPASSESIYGGSRVQARGVSNGGWSDGSYGASAAKFVREWGVAFRRDYGGSIDLTTYSAKRAKDWGYYGAGGQGQPDAFIGEVKKHPVREVALVTNFAEAAASIESGYPIPVCSMMGFSSQRDDQGFCRQDRRWAHCMCFIGARHGNRPGLLCLNSWGTGWVGGPKWPEDMPDGSFWVDAAVVDRMLAGRDSFVVSGYDGFPFRKLDHAAWVFAKPPQIDLPPMRHGYEKYLALAP